MTPEFYKVGVSPTKGHDGSTKIILFGNRFHVYFNGDILTIPRSTVGDIFMNIPISNLWKCK